MEKPEFSCAILSKLNLDDIEKVVKEAYHKEDGPGRPPRKPMGIFKALIVKRLQQIPSERELCRRLWKDDNLRELCDIEAEQSPYHPSQLSRFKKRVGARRLQRIMNKLLKELLKRGAIGGETVVLDATFVKAYSRRDPHEDSRGKSDPEARVGRNGKTFELGYKLHVAVDAKSELPIAIIVASANDNEKKHAPALLEKALKATEGRVKLLVADSQYSSRNLRDQASSQGVRAVIPFPTNQLRGQKGLLRVDKYFRTHGPIYEKRVYRLRSSIERVNSRLKDQLSLERHRVRGLGRITVHALLCMIAMLLTAMIALRLNRPEKTRSITMLAT
ncbi:transposase [Candidatus Bathyarchaeota archaeon]|nr:transposase [Candidatus Bathyarchaeota archaeon]